MFTKAEFLYWYIPVMLVIALFVAKLVMEGFINAPAAGMMVVLAAVLLRWAAKRINPPQSTQESSDEPG